MVTAERDVMELRREGQCGDIDRDGCIGTGTGCRGTAEMDGVASYFGERRVPMHQESDGGGAREQKIGRAHV